MTRTTWTQTTLAILVISSLACGEPTRPKASFRSELSEFSVYPLNGTTIALPTAINFVNGRVILTRADGQFAFDVAFDLDAAGRPVVYPARALASDLAGLEKRVGLLVMTKPFDEVREVPATGYDTLSAVPINVGQVIALEIRDLATCQFSVTSEMLYAKLTVDSVNATSRRLYVRTVVDPNCGYRSVVPDSIPES